MDTTCVAVIHRHGVHSPPRIFLTQTVGLILPDLGVTAEVDTINDDSELRSLDHRLTSERHAVSKLPSWIGIEKEFYFAIRAGDRRSISSSRSGGRDIGKRNRRCRRRRSQKVAARINVS